MKITKRILAVLVLMALLVSCVLLSVSAEDNKKTFNAEGINDIEDILEYYASDEFVADNYESQAPNVTYYSGDNSEVIVDPANENNKVLKVFAGNNEYKISVDSKALIVSFNICYDASMEGQYKLNLKTLDTNGEESITYTSFFTVNAGANKFQYSVWDSELNSGEGGFVLADFEEIAPVAGAWYKVVIFFDAEEGQYSFKIIYADKDGKPVQVDSEKISLGNVACATDLSLKTYAEERGDKVLAYIDNVEIYSGTFERTPANKGFITARTFLDLDALYNAENTDLQTQVRIAKVFDDLWVSGRYTAVFVTDEALGVSQDAVVQVQNNIPAYVNSAFAKEIVRIAEAIDVESGYAARIENIAEYGYFNSVLPENEELADAPGIDAELGEKLIAARVAIENEKTACETIADDSVKLMTLMQSYDSSISDYDGYLAKLYQSVMACEKWDITYTGYIGEDNPFTIQDAASLREEFLSKYNKLDTAAGVFINEANKMKAAVELLGKAEQDMREALSAYTEAERIMTAALEIMNGINLEDENLSEQDRALYAEQKSIFEAQKATYDEQKALYDAANVIYEDEFAKLANAYLAAKEIYNGGDIDENLDEATHSELFSLFSVYTDNEDFIIAETALSDKFISVVKDAEIATYYTSKVERLREAESYLDSIRIKYSTVAEALEKYNQLKADIASQEKAAADYIAAVNEIAKAESFADRKAAVEAATALKAEGDVLGISGVNEANMALSEAAARIETENANSVTLIALVAEIGRVRDFLTRRELLARAQYAADNTDETIEGVTDAKARLAELMEAYIEEVNKMNASHTASSEKAADLIGSAVSDENVYKAVSIIKNFINK